MQLLKQQILPLVEEAIASLGKTNLPVENMLQPSRELDQGDLTLPCFPFAKVFKCHLLQLQMP